MQARLNIWLVFAVFLASLFSTAHSLSQNGLKQITRRDVVERQQRRIDSPLRPRSSPTPCSLPDIDNIPPFADGFEESSYTSGAIMDLSPYSSDTVSFADVDFVTAAEDCANEANDAASNTFELYFETDACLWMCVVIQQSVGYPTFAVDDANAYITVAYEYVL